VGDGLILQADRRPAIGETAAQPGARVGFTVSRKVGNAVTRNRARRRLRAVAAELLPAHAAAGHDYVLVGRAGTVRRPYAGLRADLEAGLRRLGLWRDGPKPPARTATEGA
jgi:ribonuclease P protein component